ncbi:hypothetical protein BsWGS_25839 [Bradybaena similaris]
MLPLSAVCLLLISATSTVFSAPAKRDANCVDEFVADIYILTDGSNSINGVGWGRSLAFVSNFTKSFPVGPSQVQFAYGTFSTQFVHIFDLNTYYDKEELSKKVLSTTQLKGVTYTFDALKAIRVNRYINSTDKGARPGVTKIIIVITDGNSDNITSTIAEADALRREQGVRIFVVSVGSVNQVECIGIAGTERNVFTVKNFGALEAIRNQITQQVCKEPEPEPDPCPKTDALDLTFVIDSSGTVSSDNFKKNFEFVMKSILGFTLGPLATRVALLTYSTSTQVIFNLTDDDSIIFEKLSNVPYLDGVSNTHLALYKSLELLSVENGGRDQSKKVVVLVSNGHAANLEETLKAASILRGLQVLVVTLRVGPNAAEEELRVVATKPDYSFPVSDYSVLVSLANTVSDIACNVPAPPPTVKPCPTATIVDIFFLVDSSGSIGEDNYHYNFEFIGAIIDAYYIAEDGAKVAMLTFGTSVRPKFKLSADKTFIHQQLENVAYQGSTTNTHLALAYVLNNGWNTPANGARNGSQVIILITDGKSTIPDQTLVEAARVKAAGFTIIAVGVTDSIDEDELKAVASKPEYVITANDYSVLDYIASKTSDIACSEGNS